MGRRYRAFLLSYLAFRLGIDFLKPDSLFAGLSTIQWTCVLALFWCAREVFRG